MLWMSVSVLAMVMWRSAQLDTRPTDSSTPGGSSRRLPRDETSKGVSLEGGICMDGGTVDIGDGGVSSLVISVHVSVVGSPAGCACAAPVDVTSREDVRTGSVLTRATNSSSSECDAQASSSHASCGRRRVRGVLTPRGISGQCAQPARAQGNGAGRLARTRVAAAAAAWPGLRITWLGHAHEPWRHGRERRLRVLSTSDIHRQSIPCYLLHIRVRIRVSCGD